MFAVAYNGECRRCVMMVDVYPGVSMTAPVKRKMLLEWLARYVESPSEGEVAGFRLVGAFSDGDATDKALCRLIAENVQNGGIVLSGKVPDGVAGVEAPEGRRRGTRPRFRSAIEDEDEDPDVAGRAGGRKGPEEPATGDSHVCIWRGICFSVVDLAHLLALAQRDAPEACVVMLPSEVIRIKAEYDA